MTDGKPPLFCGAVSHGIDLANEFRFSGAVKGEGARGPVRDP